MANYVINTPGVVYWVLVLLQEKNYDTATIIRVTRSFLDQTVQSVFIRIGSAPDGRILVQKINQIIKCDAPGNAAAARCLKIQTVISAGAKPNGEGGKAALGEGGDQPRQLSQVEMDWYANYNEGKDGRLGGPKKTFKPEVNWQLPRNGIGYVVNSPDDLDNTGRKRLNQKLLNDTYGYDQIGTKETVEAMIRIAQEWFAKYSYKLQYGDISRPGGINTPDHSSHNVGMAWDMRILRKDRAFLPLKLDPQTSENSQYDRAATGDFIRLARSLYPETTVYFNDKVIKKEFESIVEARLGHWDHLHIMPYRKGRE